MVGCSGLSKWLKFFNYNIRSFLKVWLCWDLKEFGVVEGIGLGRLGMVLE